MFKFSLVDGVGPRGKRKRNQKHCKNSYDMIFFYIFKTILKLRVKVNFQLISINFLQNYSSKSKQIMSTQAYFIRP